MVDSVIDPVRIPTITVSPKEFSEMEQLEAAGGLPKRFVDRYLDAVESNVFGHDHKKDKRGEPIEQGIGSAGNQTMNSLNSFKKFGKYEPGMTDEKFAETVKRMEAELATCDEEREKAGTVRRSRRGRR